MSSTKFFPAACPIDSEWRKPDNESETASALALCLGKRRGICIISDIAPISFCWKLKDVHLFQRLYLERRQLKFWFIIVMKVSKHSWLAATANLQNMSHIVAGEVIGLLSSI